MTSHELINRIKVKYAAPVYATFTNVADGTGSSVNGRADAISVAAWKSRGYLIHGFEVKISRADWLRELKQPGKSELFMSYCDHWWLVASNKEIVKPGELPPTWGMLVVSGVGLGTVVPAPRLKPKPADRMFLASLLRRAIDQSSEPEAILAARAEGVAEGSKGWKDGFEKQIKLIDELRKKIDDFEKASGISLLDYRGAKEIGEAVHAVLNPNSRKAVEQQVRRLRASILDVAATLRRQERQLRELETGK